MANIQDKLNNIKNALFGRDVRDSIHDGIKAINDEVEITTTRQQDLESTFDELIINAGNSNAEIVDARVGVNGTSYAKLGDRLNQVDSQIKDIENEKINKGAIKAYEKIKYVLKKPANFIWDNIPIKIYKNGIGEFYNDLDIEKYKNTTGATYYVDIKNGLGSNDGLTPETALSNIQVALDKNDCGTVIIASGVYEHSHGFISKGINNTKKVNIIAKQDQKVIISCSAYNLSYSLVIGKSNTYQATRSGIGRIFDTRNISEDGDYLELEKLNSINEVESTPNSWYTDGTNIYVHTKDNTIPDNNIRAMFNTINTVTTSNDLYLENIQIHGGISPLKGISGGNIYAKNCKFKYSTLSNGITINSSLAIIDSCEASNNFLDGFNYNSGKAIEVNSLARNNGNTLQGDTQNGSTQHNGGKIIRINCEYKNNKGSNVGDNHANTQSWNLGCVSYGSVADIEEKYNSNFTAHTNAEMWNDGCTSFDSINANTIQDGAKMHLKDCAFIGTTKIEGTGEVDYY